MTYEEHYDEWRNQPYEDSCTEKIEIRDGVAIIPEGTTKIGNRAFEDCSSLESVTIPESVMKIDCCAFDDCSALTAIYVLVKKVDYYKELLPEELHDKIVELSYTNRCQIRVIGNK